MTDLTKLENVVAEILDRNISARSDDQYLYTAYVNAVLNNIYPNDTQNKRNNRFANLMADRRLRIRHGIAEYGSIARVRRKLQEKYEDLRPSEEAIKARQELQGKYKEYARGDK